MKLVVLTEKYPCNKDPVFTFLRSNIVELSKLGFKCEVISPQSITRPIFEKVSFRKKRWVDSIDGIEIKVHQPLYFSYGPFLIKRSYHNMMKASKKVLNNLELFDAIYCKFWNTAVIANEVDNETPKFVDCGESNIDITTIFSKDKIENMKKHINGIIYVSKKNYNDSKEKDLQQGNPYIILSNGTNTKEFFKKNKKECRKILNWPEDVFITITVGSFIERKGINRVCSAINKIDEDVYSCFIGSGPQKPNCKNILFEGTVNNNELSTYLSASDVFVLPTLNEGCCNAIIEALACGLPVISSNRDFNEGILNENNSILVDPENIDEIADAIKLLKNDKELRERLSYRSKEDIEKLDIKYRAQKIFDFISNNVK